MTPAASEPLQHAEAPLDGSDDALQTQPARREREGDRVHELGVHEERLGGGGGGGGLAGGQLLLDAPDEADRNTLLKLVHRSVEVQDLDDLPERRRRHHEESTEENNYLYDQREDDGIMRSQQKRTMTFMTREKTTAS